MLVRLRTKVGINEFQDTTPSGHTDDDYMHPFRGLHGLKHSLAIYLMKSVDPSPPTPQFSHVFNVLNISIIFYVVITVVIIYLHKK